jgi:hypothetical protein
MVEINHEIYSCMAALKPWNILKERGKWIRLVTCMDVQARNVYKNIGAQMNKYAWMKTM